MKKQLNRSIAFIIALVFVSFIHKFSLAFPNEPDGFGNIRWGIGIAELKDLNYIGSRGDRGEAKIFRRNNDIKSLGGAEIDSIEYEFFKDRFVSVTLRVKDLDNFVKLKNFLFEKHGRGEELIKGLRQFLWDGDKTIMLLISKQEIS